MGNGDEEQKINVGSDDEMVSFVSQSLQAKDDESGDGWFCECIYYLAGQNSITQSQTFRIHLSYYMQTNFKSSILRSKRNTNV